MYRTIVPEILDSLDATDPEAVRSQRDLRRLDLLLGGSRWIVRKLGRRDVNPELRICELGAGEGRLCERLARAFPRTRVTGLDLQPRPASLLESVAWVRGDFFEAPALREADVVVGSLILHHFHEEDLRRLGAGFSSARTLVFSEPWRDQGVLSRAALALPFVGKVTKHDMPASIRAGFRPGEMVAVLGLQTSEWEIAESSHWQGVIRMIACRR